MKKWAIGALVCVAAVAYGLTELTSLQIVNSQIDSTVIGSITPAAATFTTINSKTLAGSGSAIATENPPSSAQQTLCSQDTSGTIGACQAQSLSIAPGPDTGTGATASCVSGARCSITGGTVSLTTGSGFTQASFTLSASPALAYPFNCTGVENQPSQQIVSSGGSLSTSSITMVVSTPSGSPTTYTITYTCG